MPSKVPHSEDEHLAGWYYDHEDVQKEDECELCPGCPFPWQGPGTPWRWGPVATAGLACSCCTVLLLFGIIPLVGYIAGTRLVRKEYNLDSWHDPRLTPDKFPRESGCGGCDVGYKTNAQIDQCGKLCFNSSLTVAWELFNQQHGYQLVTFPARLDNDNLRVNISAWWLPADTSRLPPGKIPPRVVVQHGLASNNNHCGVQMTCYLLRSMGFGCLAPTLRDYGLSGASKHPDIAPWGWDEHFDLLGAWDYAVNDPENKLGGKLSESQVGIMGFSKGAYITANAFALERRIPAAWIDSGPALGLYSIVKAKIRPFLNVFASMIAYPIYWMADIASGHRLDKYRPLDLLEVCSPPARKVAVAFGTTDTMVPPKQNDALLHTLAGMPECYDVAMLYTPVEDCNGDSHHTAGFQRTEQYRQQLCTFWSEAFAQSTTTCGLQQLPRFHSSPYARRLSSALAGVTWL